MSPWSLSRFEIRAPLIVGGAPFARVEIRHTTRGRLTDIGRGIGPVDCLFQAIGQIVGREAQVASLDVDYRPPEATARISLVIDGETVEAVAKSDDLLTSCALAYLEAATGSN